MKIPVIFLDKSSGMVNAEDLEALIRARRIIAFRRSGGWVMIDKGPLRGTGGETEREETERRSCSHYNAIKRASAVMTGSVYFSCFH